METRHAPSPSFLLLLRVITGLYVVRPAQACPLAADCQNPCCRAPLTSPPAAPPSALMWGSLAAAAVGAFLAEMLRRRREPAGEREISDYQMKIRARKQVELEAQWAREAVARKQAQAYTAALDAKIERMEAEEERRWQPARTPARSAFDMAKWKQQDYAESARWEQQQAYQAYRQGEWAELPKTPTPTPTPTPSKTPPPTLTPTTAPTTPVKPPQPDPLPPSPVPACTMPPTPQVFIGPAPTKQPTPTSVPPLTGQDVAHGICEAADLVDPVMPDPATVGGPDVGDLIDQAYVAQQNIPYGSATPLFEPLIRVPIIAAKVFKDGPSTVFNFACQQIDKEGPYYELFPIDQKIQAVKDKWSQMDTRQKVLVVVGVTLITLLVAIPLLVK